MAQHEPIRKRTTPTGSKIAEIPDKLYFRIGDVARLCDIQAYVLRFWETEFPQLKPNKGGTGQRLYRRRDVETALRIKSLLYDQGYTIPGARQLLKSEQKLKEPMLPLPILDAGAPQGINPEPLKKIRTELQGLLALLSKPATPRPGRPAIPAVHPIRQPRATRLTSRLFEASDNQHDLG